LAEKLNSRAGLTPSNGVKNLKNDSRYVRDLRNIERIDVLKGPAAVLYGRGSQGGIVNRVRRNRCDPGRRSLYRQSQHHGVAGLWPLGCLGR